MIYEKDYNDQKKSAEALIAARTKATWLVDDAKARYIKEKTKVRSKKTALEKDAAIHAKRFDCLADFESKEDIHEYYGMGCITESRCDYLMDLWDEREAIKEASVDGVYADHVTACLDAARLAVQGMFEDDISEFDVLKREYAKQKKEQEEAERQMHREYMDWKYGRNT